MVNDIKIQPGAPIALAKFDRISIPSTKNIYTWSYDTSEDNVPEEIENVIRTKADR